MAAVGIRVAVVLASVGRARELASVIDRLQRQSVPPHMIVCSVHESSDLPAGLPANVITLFGSKGLCSQRNRGLDRVKADADVVAFFDDDFVPSLRSIAGIAGLFGANPDIVGATGKVLDDGVTKGGIDDDEANALVDAYDAQPAAEMRVLADLERAYGCNMCFRLSAMGDLRFDETLPLYGWQEDVDFAARMARRGRVVETNAFAGVHRGVAKARSPGVRLGYSQIVNPIYLVRKGTMRYRHAASLIARNLLANHVRSMWPEAWIDRRGRAKGNWRAIFDVARGKIEPGRILEIDT